MHVGLALLTFFPGRVGGTETVVRNLLDRFAVGEGPERVSALVNRHGTGPLAEYARGPVRLREVRSYRAGDSMRTRALAMAFARAAPGVAARDAPRDLDVVHYAVTIPIPRVTAPSVVTLHDVQHHEMPELFSPFERRFRRWAYDGSARAADLVITPSEHARAGAIGVLGIAPGKVVAIPHGVDHARFRPEPGPDGDALAELDLPPRYLVYPANLWPHKNHERLLEGLARAADRSIALVLCGADYGRLGALQETARRLGVADRLRHLGFVPAPALPAILRRAAGMVFPSLFEGFGTPPLEAMACGCPVATSTAGSLAEVVGDAALTFDPRDPDAIAGAIDRLAGDDALRERLRSAGVERAARFTWDACAQRHHAAYRSVAA